MHQQKNELRRAAPALTLLALLAACSAKDAAPPAGTGGAPQVTTSGGSVSAGASATSGFGGNSASTGGLNAATGGSPVLTGGAASGGSSQGGSTSGGARVGGSTSGGAGVGGASGGATGGTGGLGATGGSGGKNGASAGAAGSAAAGAANSGGVGALGSGSMMGSGKTDMRYQTVSVSRDGVPYILITNGWGPGFGSHTVSWNGTAFSIENMMGTAGPMFQPASYPSVFCGKYSVMQVPACGLPASIDSLKTLRTGWRWAANGNSGEYNAAYDIWVGDGTRLQAYLMVWLRDPPGQQPAGQPNPQFKGITVTNAPGAWDIWNGMVNGLPIVNYVRTESSDSAEIEFDVMDFYRDAKTRGLNLPGTSINAVAVGFEIWEGPVTNLQTLDFYVKVN